MTRHIKKAIKKLPWGEEVYIEIPIFKYRNQFYARHGKTNEGREYLEFSKFGPKPNNEQERYSQKLRIYKAAHWSLIKHIVEDQLAQSIGWNLDVAQEEFDAKLLAKMTDRIKKQSKELNKNQKLVQELVENVGLYRDQYIKNRVPEFKNLLKEFKKLVKEQKPESSYQKFLKKNFWIFGLEYVSARSQKRAGADNIPDFSLERYDKFRDIVEIKRPQDDVFTQSRKRVHQSAKLKEALAEVMDYVDYFLKHENDEAVEHGETYYKPKAIIVLGHSKGNADKIRQLNSFLHRIEILTYDDLIERAQKIIDFYEVKKKTKQ